MKNKRYKKAQRVLGFFQHSFDLRPPYNVLLDGTFCNAALEAKVKIREQIPKYLGSHTKLVTTQCIIMEAEKLSMIRSNLYGTWMIVKQFPVHKCGHEGNCIPASSCIKSLLKKKNPAKYIVASQDDDIRQHINRWVTGAPVLYLHRSAPTLEKPTEKCYAAASESVRLTAHEENTLKSLKRRHIGEGEEPPPKKKKKPKNPNPLSCKKSKKTKPQPKKEDGNRKRKRHKKKSFVELSTQKC